VAATSTHGSMGQQWRFSVRLDSGRAARLEKVSAEVGCSPSEVLRRSLDCYLASRSPKPAIQRPEMKMAPAGVRPLPITTGESPKEASAASPGPRPTATVKAATSWPSTPTNPTLSLRSKIDEFVRQYRAFGSEIWPERRRLFQRLFAAAYVAQENSENPKDSELYAELLKLGQRFGLFS
jgi:hypothetical protein